MKKANLGLLALASILGIGSAFTSAHQNTATTYYAQTDGVGSFIWTTADPALTLGYHCDLNKKIAYCTILSNVNPGPGNQPSAPGPRKGVYVP